MASDKDIAPEVQLLNELRAALDQLGIGVQLHDSVPGLALGTTTPGLYVWVFVSDSGRAFTWRRGDSKHPVDDMRGAAAEIARYVSEQSGHINGAAEAGDE